MDTNKRLNEIIDKMNELQAEKEDLEISGATDVEMALDFIADATADGEFDEYAEYIPPEQHLDEIREACERNLATLQRIEDKQGDLKIEYNSISDAWPHYYEATHRYGRSYHEHF